MKNLLKQHLLLLILLVMTKLVWGGEFTGAGKEMREVLIKNNINPKALENSGHQLMFGEMTGAGKRMDLDRIKVIVTKHQAFWTQQAEHVEYKHPSAAKSLNDVVYLEFEQKRIGTHEITGVVIK